MIDRDTCFSALFKLKNAGIDVSDALFVMANEGGVPRRVIEFLRENSPHFQFYRHLQKHQKALAHSLLDYQELSPNKRIITASSFITRVYLAVEYNEIDSSLLEDINVQEIVTGLARAIRGDFSLLDREMLKHGESLKLFYQSKS